MTPGVVQLVSTLRTAGVRFALVDGRVRVDAPLGFLTPADKEALRWHRDALLALLRAEERPEEPCFGCDTVAWTWCPDWPIPGAGRWLCGACLRRPAPSRSDAAADLSEAEWSRLDAEAAAGDVLARLILATVSGTATAGCERGEHPDAGRHDDRHGDHPDGGDDPHQSVRGVPTARKAR